RRLRRRLGLHGTRGRARRAPEGVQRLPGQREADGHGPEGGLHALPSRSSWGGGHQRGHRRPSLRRLSAGRESSLRADGADGRAAGRMNIVQQFYAQLLEVLRHLGPVEVVDVLVVAFVLYQLLRLLRGTQGTQILVGLVLLAVVGVAATTFNLILL